MQWIQLEQACTNQSSLYRPPALRVCWVLVKHCRNETELFIFSYKDDMEPDELFEVISQCLLSSVDRDAYSGWGGEVYIVTPETITVRKLKTRMD